MTDYSNFDKWCSDAHFVRILFSKLRKFPNGIITRPPQLYDFRKNEILPQNLIQTILRKYVLIFRSLAISLPSINAKCSRTWVLQNKDFSAVSLIATRLIRLFFFTFTYSSINSVSNFCYKNPFHILAKIFK